MVDIARHAQRLVVDVVDFEAADSSIGGRTGDLGFEELFELEGPCGLARRGVARDEDKLHACLSANNRDPGRKGALTGIFCSAWGLDYVGIVVRQNSRYDGGSRRGRDDEVLGCILL